MFASSLATASLILAITSHFPLSSVQGISEKVSCDTPLKDTATG